MSSKTYTREDLILLADKLVRSKKPFGQLDKNGKYLKGGNKGDLGQLIEEFWFGQKPHNDPEPDFKDAKVELKVSPYYKTKNGISAKERLVCDIINYENESLPDKTFYDSSFWHKCENILLLSYLHQKNKKDGSSNAQKRDMLVDHFALIEGFPEEDLIIIMQDWSIIVSKIRDGKAHELSEGDTKYLGACTKGDKAETSYVSQPFSTVLAKKRAYSLKTTYMTRLLRKYIFGVEESPHVIKDVKQLKDIGFDELIIKKIMRYKNRSDSEIAREAGIIGKSKNFYARLTNYMLGLTAIKEQCEEFKSANIQVKSIHIDTNGTIREHVSFPSFKFQDLISQEWEDSDFYNDIVSARFLFIVYRIDEKGCTKLDTVGFWNMPNEDVEEAHRVWSLTIDRIRSGVHFWRQKWGNGQRICNDLPGVKDSPIIHVRPHTGKSAYRLNNGTIIGNIHKDGDKLPNGEWMTKQSFWLNSNYVKEIITKLRFEELKKYPASGHEYDDERYSTNAATKDLIFNNEN